MASMNISLPDEMKEWAQSKGKSGLYNDASDYVRDLIRKDQEREYKTSSLQRLWDEGLKSGISEKNVDDILKEVIERNKSEQEAAI